MDIFKSMSSLLLNNEKGHQTDSIFNLGKLNYCNNKYHPKCEILNLGISQFNFKVI